MRLEASIRRRASEVFLLEVDLDLRFDRERPLAALFGPSGSGKSTTLAVLAGLVRPDSGRVLLDGEPLLDTARGIDVPPERRGIGLVPQDGLLFPHLRVRDNLRYAERRARGRAHPAFDDVVALLGIEDHLKREPGRLSGGERQRVALARALLSGPRLLLLDEPVSALDERSRFRALGYVERVARELSVPTLYVSHAALEVQRIAPVVARLEAGRVVAVGPAAEVLPADPQAGPAWNLLRVRAAPGPPGTTTLHGEAAGVPLTLPRPVPSGAVLWCRLASDAVTLLPSGAESVSSARNRLPGRVLRVHGGGARARVEVDAGLPLQVDVTPDAVRELGLAPGVRVTCVFKALAVETLG